MKNINRFSKLLKSLTSIVGIKNYTLAKELQYDESYISKWMTGASIPTEKNSEKILRDISTCVVNSMDQESRSILYSDYQVTNDCDLKEAIFDNLKVEFEYVVNLKETTGVDIVQETVFYPELTLTQFLKKMRHPILRQVKSLNVIMAADIFSLDSHYQLALAELENNVNVNMLQRQYPGVSFSMLINFKISETNNMHNVQFIQSLLTNLANIDFRLYTCPQSKGKILFAVKEAYAITGMIMDENHCLSVTTSEELKNCNVIYDRLQSFCSKEALVVRSTNILQMLQTNEYMQYVFSRNQRWLLSYITEQLLPDDVFAEIATSYCEKNKEIEFDNLNQMHKLSDSVLKNMHVKILLTEMSLNDFAVNGIVDFFGTKIQVSSSQRLRCLEYIENMLEQNSKLNLYILKNGTATSWHHIPTPSLFLSDTFCYMRITRTGLINTLSILSERTVCDMFRKYYDEIYENQEFTYREQGIIGNVIDYAKQMVLVQLSVE